MSTRCLCAARSLPSCADVGVGWCAGIGGITALKLVRQHGSIEKILEAIDTAK